MAMSQRSFLAAYLAVAIMAVAVLLAGMRQFPASPLTVKERLWCRSYLPFITSKEKREQLEAWADAEVFSREFSRADFRFSHFSGPGRPMALRNAPEAVRYPGSIPTHYELRVLPNPGEPFNAIFISGGKYSGLVVARGAWEDAIDGRHLKERGIKMRSGRVGLLCYTD